MLHVGKILKNTKVAKDIFEMVIESPDIAAAARPGQFVNLRLTEKLDPLLRRPISLHDIDTEAGTITMLYLIVGKGTEMMSKMEADQGIDVLGPLGNGWNCEFEGENAVLVGGGIGTAPLFPLAKALVKTKKNVCLIVGAKNKDYLTDITRYEKIGVTIKIATDDGSEGRKGFVTQLVDEAIDEGLCDCLYACGPAPMLCSIEKTALEKGVPGQVSTESHMGCGLGVCLLCPNKVKSGGYKRTCIEGPVFTIGELDYE